MTVVFCVYPTVETNLLIVYLLIRAWRDDKQVTYSQTSNQNFRSVMPLIMNSVHMGQFSRLYGFFSSWIRERSPRYINKFAESLGSNLDQNWPLLSQTTSVCSYTKLITRFPLDPLSSQRGICVQPASDSYYELLIRFRIPIAISLFFPIFSTAPLAPLLI